MKNVNITIIDRHRIFREGIKAILTTHNPGYHIAGESDNALEILELCQEISVDLVIMDPKNSVSNGIETIEEFQNAKPSIKTLILTEPDNHRCIQKFVNADVSGYMLKSTGKKELVKAVDTILNGEKYYNNEITQLIIKDYMDVKGEKKYEGDPDSLTERECEILLHICREYTNQEIGDKLSISVRTVDSHRRNLLQKTGARNTAGLVRFAIEHELFSI